MTEILERLFEMSDKKYANFSAKLTPGIEADSFIGVRVPLLRAYAKEISGSPLSRAFIGSLPHKYFDENILHSLLLEKEKDYDVAIARVEEFLPYVNNWAVCDILRPKVFAKNTDKLICKIREWIKSKETYTCRFGIGMLMTHCLDGNFKAEYLDLPASIVSDEYYVNMMIAWFYATALAKQQEATLPYIEGRRLPVWVHNKTIQKAVESYRLTDGLKKHLKTLRVSNGR